VADITHRETTEQELVRVKAENRIMREKIRELVREYDKGGIMSLQFYEEFMGFRRWANGEGWDE
jgi:hypothetical protein